MGLFLQAERFMRGMLEQWTRRFVAERRLKGSWGMLEMPVLSQIILAREASRSAVFWPGVNTPGFSYHILSTENGTKCS